MTFYEDDGSWLWPEEEEVPSGQYDGKEGVASSAPVLQRRWKRKGQVQ